MPLVSKDTALPDYSCAAGHTFAGERAVIWSDGAASPGACQVAAGILNGRQQRAAVTFSYMKRSPTFASG
jgi:hypothetical protein